MRIISQAGSNMHLRTRLEKGGTPLASKWGIEGLTVYAPDVAMIGNGGGVVTAFARPRGATRSLAE